MYFVADRNGNITEEDSFQDRLLEWMYAHRIGRILLRPLMLPFVSRIGGKLLNSRISRPVIRPFIYKQKINMSEYKEKQYVSYNDFFTRELVSGARKVEKAPGVFISPCDSRLMVYRIDGEGAFRVKHTFYTVQQLLRDKKLAERYRGGYVWVFRLCVQDYHRYIYVDNGRESAGRAIPGVFHTVNPAAGNRIPIYKENTREYSLLKSENFGTVLQMEVGALLVGKIENRREKIYVKRGEEKGNFAFGGSTVILMTQAGKARPDKDILKNSARGIETGVKLGERIGNAAAV